MFAVMSRHALAQHRHREFLSSYCREAGIDVDLVTFPLKAEVDERTIRIQVGLKDELTSATYDVCSS